MQCPAPGSGQSQTQVQTGWRMDQELCYGEILGVLDKKLDMSQQCVCLDLRRPTMCWATAKAAWPVG